MLHLPHISPPAATKPAERGELNVKVEDIVPARKQRKLTYNPGQTCITDYFNY